MKYEIHNDRIIMREEDGKAVAQIQYPEVGKDVCEIAHIYGENSATGRAHADLLMEMAVAEIRKSGRRLIPGCAFATHWFSRHPEEQDVVTDWDTLKQMEEALYSERTKEIVPASQNEAPNVQEASVSEPDPVRVVADEGAAEPEAVYDEEEYDPFVKKERGRKSRRASRKERRNAEREAADQEAAKAEIEAAKAEKEAQIQERIRREQEEKQRAIMEDAWEEEEKTRKGEQRLDSSLKVVLRVLQVLSLLCMVGILVMYLSAAISQRLYVLDDLSFPKLVCLGLTAFIVIFGIIQMIWIMSRKRLRDDFGNKLDERYDPGRGVFGFILILIISFVCGLAVNYIPKEIVEFIGVSQFSEVYQMRIIPIVYASVAGLVLCLIRKIAGRQMIR